MEAVRQQAAVRRMVVAAAGAGCCLILLLIVGRGIGLQNGVVAVVYVLLLSCLCVWCGVWKRERVSVMRDMHRQG